MCAIAELAVIAHGVRRFGEDWSMIRTQMLPNRTENEIKAAWKARAIGSTSSREVRGLCGLTLLEYVGIRSLSSEIVSPVARSYPSQGHHRSLALRRPCLSLNHSQYPPISMTGIRSVRLFSRRYLSHCNRAETLSQRPRQVAQPTFHILVMPLM